MQAGRLRCYTNSKKPYSQIINQEEIPATAPSREYVQGSLFEEDYLVRTLDHYTLMVGGPPSPFPCSWQ